MTEKDIKLDGQRVRFSRKIKRKILLEIAKGRKPQEVFLEFAFDSFDEITKDKKYASKLLYKWRQELYQNKEILNLLNHDVDNKMIEDEIRNIGEDEEKDNVLDGVIEELKENFLKRIFQQNVL